MTAYIPISHNRLPFTVIALRIAKRVCTAFDTSIQQEIYTTKGSMRDFPHPKLYSMIITGGRERVYSTTYHHHRTYDQYVVYSAPREDGKGKAYSEGIAYTEHANGFTAPK